MQIEITGVGQSLYPIGVSRFKDETGISNIVTDVIRANLTNNGRFFNIDLGNNELAENAAPDFEKTKGEMISFHMLKVVDHQKVVDCLKRSESFESMNGCNKYLEKYIKKEDKEQESEEGK
jgi:hypothetical protein